MSMFDNYPQSSDYIPNNRPHCCKHKGLDIMTGETAEHIFEIPFNVEDSCNNLEIIYKLGLTPILVKDINGAEFTLTDHNTTIIKCVLSEEETSLFNSSILDTKVQLKFYMKNDTITYSEIYDVKVVDSLDSK